MWPVYLNPNTEFPPLLSFRLNVHIQLLLLLALVELAALLPWRSVARGWLRDGVNVHGKTPQGTAGA